MLIRLLYEDFNIFTKATGQIESTYNKRYSASIAHEIATGMAWQQAKDYCQWLGQQVGTSMDLPTEAQWEYVARNKGQSTLFAITSRRANYIGESSHDLFSNVLSPVTEPQNVLEGLPLTQGPLHAANV